MRIHGLLAAIPKLIQIIFFVNFINFYFYNCEN